MEIQESVFILFELLFGCSPQCKKNLYIHSSEVCNMQPKVACNGLEMLNKIVTFGFAVCL